MPIVATIWLSVLGGWLLQPSEIAAWLVDRTLVGAEQPSLGQRGDAMDSREQLTRAPPAGASGPLAARLMGVAGLVDAAVAPPSVGDDSRNLATEAKKGMRQKAKNGGTPGIAPFGYVNASQRTEEGREVRTVLVDPDRAKWVPWIFERYATGDWTVGMLQEELAAHGVNTLPRPHRPASPLSKSHIASILKNRYYVGAVTFEGVEYPGKHEALISEELFDRCQRIRTGRIQSGEKPRVHTHYLKGSVFCGRCGEPLSFEITRNGRGVYYEYFYCLGRQVQKNGCDFVATQVPIIERLVEDHWQTIQLGDDMIRDIRQIVWDHLDRVLPARDKQRSDAEARLSQLKRESDKLLQAYYADAIDVDALRAEQARIAATRAVVERALEVFLSSR